MGMGVVVSCRQTGRSMRIVPAIPAANRLRPALSAASHSRTRRPPSACAAALWSDGHRQNHPLPEIAMLKWSLVFALIALVAGVLGFTGIAAGAAAIAKLLFFVFAVLFILFVVLGTTIFKKITD
jgi:uncharacterized membrane protein YtjA (UPF0391 family)